ncbi:MAG: AAA family ATPase [Methanosphaera stadtmanae]|nr:AAA family ATPase [Methanosphaera stadtmanae]
MATDDYTWIPFYMEFADKLLEYKNNRPELIEKIIKLWDNIDMNMPQLELNNEIEDMDPFTIFGLFNKHLTDENRIRILKYMKDEFNIKATVPKTFTGIPMLNPQMATFYFFKDKRGEDDINNLWEIFELAIIYSKNKNESVYKNFVEVYDKLLTQMGIRWNITMGLYWIRPYDYINLDSRSRWFLSNPDNFDKDFATEIASLKNPPIGEHYLSLIDKCKSILFEKDFDFTNLPELSYKAYVVSREDDEREKEAKYEGIGDINSSNEINYWLFAPGPSASMWKTFYDRNVMGMGGDYLGDLTKYSSREEIVKALQKHYNNNSRYTNDSLAYWQFVHEIKMGDIIFVKKGIHEIVGYGVVDSSYVFDESLGEYAHSLGVKWEEKGHWPFEGNLILKTLTKITDYPDLVKTISDFFETSPDDVEQVPEYPMYSKEDFLSEAFISEDDYYTLTNLLEHKKNLILQGAPGVGKTFIAKRLAYSLLGCKDKSKVVMVQFHQSYSYEDFIMGYRPSVEGFTLKNGVFYDFCKMAQDDEENDYFFIIDEINRGNLSKIFGELFMLLENDKRGSNNKIQLLYNDELFYIPKNVYIIGMMNTADRSLALLDYALRRRFSFFNLTPAFDSDNFVEYRNALSNIKFNKVINTIKELNKEIASDETLGEGFMIGHSYFTNLKQENVNKKLEYVIEYEIIPLLQEYWFDEESKVERWSNNLRSVLDDTH